MSASKEGGSQASASKEGWIRQGKNIGQFSQSIGHEETPIPYNIKTPKVSSSNYHSKKKYKKVLCSTIGSLLLSRPGRNKIYSNSFYMLESYAGRIRKPDKIKKKLIFWYSENTFIVINQLYWFIAANGLSVGRRLSFWELKDPGKKGTGEEL